MRWHLVTSEYPPDLGGVSDHSRLVAHGVAATGDEVVVWCPGNEASARTEAGGAVSVMAVLGRFRPSELNRAGALLDLHPAPRLLLVQWVPHGFGMRAVNVPFAIWLWRRVQSHGDQLEVMVHEAGLPFVRGKVLQNLAAVAQRLMIGIAVSYTHLTLPTKRIV